MAWFQSYVRNLSLQVRGILNKLTPEKFQKLSDDLLQTELNSGVILKGVILLVSIAAGTF
jgi:translation initiation factor 4G